MSAAAIEFSDEEIKERMSGNLCRCGAYAGICGAIRETFAVTLFHKAATCGWASSFIGHRSLSVFFLSPLSARSLSPSMIGKKIVRKLMKKAFRSRVWSADNEQDHKQFGFSDAQSFLRTAAVSKRVFVTL